MDITSENCQIAVEAVFEELALWREDLNRNFTEIIKTHRNSFSQNVTYLVTKVSNMQEELSKVKDGKNCST